MKEEKWPPVRALFSLFEMYWPLWSPVRYLTHISLFEPLSSPRPTRPVTTRRKHLSLSHSNPTPRPPTRAFWLATTLVTLLALLFSAYFIFYLTGRQDAYMTNAEDLGIMDQAIWNTLHGHLLHQSICNIVSDTNCYSPQGITRFAIHFEPILFPISLLYLLWPTPKTLLILQALVVASGAFPAFWLARLRLRSEWAGVAFALLYLLYPAQQNALIFDFHAVTLTSALLLFTLYFMYTQRTAWFFIFAILAMACKEEIPLIVACLGLWSMLLQRRCRTGLLLFLLAAAWTGLALLVIHLISPTGHSLLASRYAYLGNTPLQIARTLLVHPLGILKQHLLDRAHRTYLASLLAPAGYLPLLTPWVLILAVPTLALNLLSSNPGMHSGLFQYNAEIVPILILATIESMALILWLAQNLYELSKLNQNTPLDYQASSEKRKCRGTLSGGQAGEPGRLSHYPCGTLPGGQVNPVRGTGNPAPTHQMSCDSPPRGNELAVLPAVGAPKHNGRPLPHHLNITLLALMLALILFSVTNQDYTNSAMPFARGYRWPHTTTHTQLAQRFIDMIPPTASVSAQTRLVPHLSQRLNIYMFPYADDRATYILLDLTGDRYPYFNAQAYTSEVQKVLQSGNYGILAAQDGYLLLERGLSPPTTPSLFLKNQLFQQNTIKL